MVDWIGAVLMARDARAGAAGSSHFRFDLELRCGPRRTRIRWRHRDSARAIGDALERIGGRMVERARAELAANKIVRFGPLALAEHGIEWGGKAPLPRGTVEAVELFDTSPLELRVMKKGKVLPYAAAKTRRIPNVLAALEIADSLGYTVRGRELLAPISGGGR